MAARKAALGRDQALGYRKAGIGQDQLFSEHLSVVDQQGSLEIRGTVLRIFTNDGNHQAQTIRFVGHL